MNYLRQKALSMEMAPWCVALSTVEFQSQCQPRGGQLQIPDHIPPGTCFPAGLPRSSGTISLLGQRCLTEEISKGISLPPICTLTCPSGDFHLPASPVDQQAPTTWPPMARSSGHLAMCASLSACLGSNEKHCGLHCHSYGWNF